MEDKIVMQQVVAKLEDTNMTMYDIYTWLQMHKNRLIEEEKEQILQAFVAGDERHLHDTPNAESYYTKLTNPQPHDRRTS